MSTVQGLLSLQIRSPVPEHTPAEHTSLVVHVFLSSQLIVLGVCTQPVAGSQLSSVHGFPSSQESVPLPEQVPREQVSMVVQRSSSLHERLLGVFTHPESGLHTSLVQMLSSSQSKGAFVVQLPSRHTSPVVHGFPSSQTTALGAKTQPVARLQESSVQSFPSSQTSEDGPEVHALSAQTSPRVHAFPSLQAAVLGV